MTLPFVAPFLHGSARNQAFQAGAARHSAVPLHDLPTLPAKEISASTWVLGTGETIAVIAVMIAGYWVSGILARRRTTAAALPAVDAGDLVEA
jgi:H+/gluconate symporter-like permease